MDLLVEAKRDLYNTLSTSIFYFQLKCPFKLNTIKHHKDLFTFQSIFNSKSRDSKVFFMLYSKFLTHFVYNPSVFGTNKQQQ